MKDNILHIFKKCSFEELNDKNFKELILDNLPKDFIYKYDYGASKLVIFPDNEEGYVIKIPFSGYFDCEYEEFYYFANANNDGNRCWDYCFTELLIYHSAKSNDVNQILAKPHLIGTVKNYPIYIQEKAETYEIAKKKSEKRNSIQSTDKIYSICQERNYAKFNLDWITDVYNYYGDKQFNKIMNFIAPIGDLHDANIGYIGSRPVILDYSDFMS